MAQVLASHHRDGSSFMRSPSSSTLFDSNYSLRKNQNSLPNLRVISASSSHISSLRSTPSSSLSLDTSSDGSSSEDDYGLSLPDYGNSPRHALQPATLQVQPASPALKSALRHPCLSPSPIESFSLDESSTTPGPPPMAEDDTAVRKEPSHHVDYLSYNWREEDIWSSWRHIVEHRSVYGERSRLENASWRTWAKAQFKLKTVSPDTLNW
jgi:hypothetical protein